MLGVGRRIPRFECRRQNEECRISTENGRFGFRCGIENEERIKCGTRNAGARKKLQIERRKDLKSVQLRSSLGGHAGEPEFGFAVAVADCNYPEHVLANHVSDVVAK